MIEVGNYRYTNQDARKTLTLAVRLFDLLERGNDPQTIASQRDAVVAALAVRLDVDASLGLEELGILAAKSFGLPGWDTKAVATVLTILHEQWESAASALRINGELPKTADGVVTQLNTSAGGVPKLPRDSLDVTYTGVRGDSQNNRQHHGRPWQALCLWNAEGISEMQADGHPIFAGATGENITISGIEWTDVRPATRLLIGDSVLAEIWAYTLPCKQQAGWLSDGDFMRLHYERGNFSRVYARVLQTGRIAVGDTVTLEPTTMRRPQQPVSVTVATAQEPTAPEPTAQEPTDATGMSPAPADPTEPVAG